MNKNDQNFLVQKIRTQYTEKDHTQLDALKKLDSKVKRPVTLFTYIFGSVSAMIMGFGMSLIMTDISTIFGWTDPMLLGIIVSAIGMLMAVSNYPVYKRILTLRKRKYADQIFKLSDQIMNL